MERFLFVIVVSIAAALALIEHAWPASDGAFANFDPARDALCFRNKTSELASILTLGPLGPLGSKAGVCQGMSALVSAFAQNAVFNPTRRPSPSNVPIGAVIGLVVEAYHENCDFRVEVPGFDGLTSYCEFNRDAFLTAAIAENARLAALEIAPLLPEFLGEGHRIRSLVDRREQLNALLGFERALADGRPSLMLIHSHVLSVLGLDWLRDPVTEAVTAVSLKIWDPNHPEMNHTRVITFEDGLPSIGQTKLWNITPTGGSPSACSKLVLALRVLGVPTVSLGQNRRRINELSMYSCTD